MTEPTMRILSLGAGVQSSVLALMAADGTLPGLDAAIFANTGWEPPAVYRQVKRLSEDLAYKGIPTYKVSRGNIHTDTTDPDKRFVSLPWYILAPIEAAKRDCPSCNGSGMRNGRHCRCREGMGRRQCTAEYKLAEIMRQTRILLGAEAPRYRSVKRGRVAEQWIGFSTDEITRVNDKPPNLYTYPRHPLLELGMSRKDCERWLKAQGWGHTVKSACIGCPMHGNAHWRAMRDTCDCGVTRDKHANIVGHAFRSTAWNEAVAFDKKIRHGGARGPKLRGQAFLHRSRVPLDQAPIDRVTANEWADRRLDIFDELADLDELENGATNGCSPHGCRSGDPVALVPVIGWPDYRNRDGAA